MDGADMARPDLDRLFDHDFDGIQEYDNPLPGWWTWTFVATIALAFPYVLYYHFGDGPSVHDALAAEREAYAQKLLATYGELAPDEPTLIRYMGDDVAMTGMAPLFKGRCATCHLADGSGNVGPNLTDEHWIDVRQIGDLPRVIGEGVVTKGMPAWKDTLTPTQIVLLSSYVARLRDRPVSGKSPQGDVVPPWPREVPAAESPGGAAE
jgi:cytochrome c oxidase cbb3-type subunit 3